MILPASLLIGAALCAASDSTLRAPFSAPASAPADAAAPEPFEPSAALDRLALGLKKRYPHARARERIDTTVGLIKRKLPEVPPENPVKPRHIGLVGAFLDGRMGAKVLEYRLKEAGLDAELKAALEARRQASLERSERALEELEASELPFSSVLMAPVREEPAGVGGPDLYLRHARKRPRDARAQANLGTALAAAGRPAEAVRAFDAALALGADASALAGRAAAWHALGEFVRAREDALAALELDPGDESAAATLKLSEGRVARPAEGAAAAQAAALTAPERAAVAAAPLEPSAALAEAVPASVEGARRLNEKALAALRLDDRPAALEAAARARELYPANAFSDLVRGLVALRDGRPEEALAEAEQGLRRAPSDLALLRLSARAANRARRPEAAAAAAGAWLELAPEEPAALAELAHARGLLGDRDGMMELLERAARRDPRYEVSARTALTMPEGSDMLFLFPGEKTPEEVLALLRGARAPAPRAPWRTLAMAAAAALLLGAGLLSARLFARRAGGPRPAMRGEDRRSAPGVLAGKFEVLGVIDEGGMGLVYEGRDLSLSRRVAIKRLRAELKAHQVERRRFVEEARIVARLRHPNVVDIYAVVEEHDEVYLVFEFVDGETLHDLVWRRGRLDWDEAAAVFRGIAAAVDFAHRRGVVHRDLKLSNVILSRDGAVKVMDFGVARAAKDAASRLVVTGEVAGTPAYMAPEQERGEARPESDVYALGVCLYEMVCGCRPFSGDGPELSRSKAGSSFLRPSAAAPGVPPGFDAVIEKALHPEPSARFASAGEMSEALRALTVSRA